MAVKQGRFIVITTINNPTEAINKYAQWKSWKVIVVGDLKTPGDWQCNGVRYFNVKDQNSYPHLSLLSKKIPVNTYARKMFGYAYAIQNGAKAIFETDDDNIPYDNAETVLNNILESKDKVLDKRVRAKSGWLNIYHKFGAKKCWPRGFPLEHVRSAGIGGQDGIDLKPWSIMQFLANNDPDVDAIFRLLVKENVVFAKNRRYLLDEGTLSPFNSQATLWLPEAFPFLFLPIKVNDRVADILRGYIALCCLWKINRTLAFSSPIVFQKRNPHNLLNDLLGELQLYLNAEKWIKLLSKINGGRAEDYYLSALSLLHKERFLSKECRDLYKLFISISGIK